MQARAIDSSPVIDQRGELLGMLSRNKMNRNVGGFGHDPKTEPVEAHIEKNNAYCFEDQTIAEAEQMMLNANLGEVFVVTREKLLVGTINIEAIAELFRRCLPTLPTIFRRTFQMNNKAKSRFSCTDSTSAFSQRRVFIRSSARACLPA